MATNGLSTVSRDKYRRSACVMEAASSSLPKSMSQVSLGRVSSEQRPPVPSLKSGGRPVAEKRHSRNISGGGVIEAPNFSRKFSADDYSRMFDTRYQNMLEVTDAAGPAAVATATPPAREKKRHWWQGKPKREETWMDTVVKSGCRSGVMLRDDVAGAPIVRY